VTGPDANTECSVRIDSGTSFSAPVLAGATTLIRQYFTDGWYPSGFRNDLNSFVPSGALLKAMLVGGGQALTHITDTVVSKKTEWGDNNQGYGRADLSETLSFGVPSTLNGLTLFVRGAADSSSPYYVSLSKRGQSHSYTFTTAKKLTRSVRVVMAYTDYYGLLPLPRLTHISLSPSIHPSIPSQELSAQRTLSSMISTSPSQMAPPLGPLS
jgi:hypothetical protein